MAVVVFEVRFDSRRFDSCTTQVKPAVRMDLENGSKAPAVS